MAPNKTDIIVYAHWQGMPDPIKMGVLSAQEARGHLAWSFAYDMNPSIDKAGLALNIDLELNALDYDLARSIGEYFNLNKKEMNTIIEKVQETISNWEEVAVNIGIPSAQRHLMAAAFNFK